jgi:hypothetical protein
MMQAMAAGHNLNAQKVFFEDVSIALRAIRRTG